MTYFQPCKLNCQICKTYFCFRPSFSALSFANSATPELTLANRNFEFQLSRSIETQNNSPDFKQQFEKNHLDFIKKTD